MTIINYHESMGWNRARFVVWDCDICHRHGEANTKANAQRQAQFHIDLEHRELSEAEA